jgi:L-aspartate oxidase
MGGVLTDAQGRTTLDGLWAAGEVASTGAHGANRLASNSLLEAVVYAARIADDIRAMVPTAEAPARTEAAAHPAVPMTIAPERERALRDLMSSHVGVLRDGAGMRHALVEIARMEREWSRVPQLRNMATTALLITAAALKRTESRGGHYRSDYPQTDAAQATRTFITLDDARAIAAAAERDINPKQKSA